MNDIFNDRKISGNPQIYGLRRNWGIKLAIMVPVLKKRVENDLFNYRKVGSSKTFLKISVEKKRSYKTVFVFPEGYLL